jgi:hypothetical protein
LTGPKYLQALGKKTMRELTDSESKDFENYKFFVLCQLDADKVVDDEAIKKAAAKELAIPSEVDELLKATITTHIEKNGKEPTVDAMRRYQVGAYAFWKGEFVDGQDQEYEEEYAEEEYEDEFLEDEEEEDEEE